MYLQVVRGYNAIQTGVIFTAATLGILVSSLAAGRPAQRFQQRTLIVAGFVTTIAGVGPFAPGLPLIGLGLGVMLTSSVNVVQSALPEERQGEISGLSRSVSNLGSCFGTAVAGTILVSVLTTPTRSYALAMIVVGPSASSAWRPRHSFAIKNRRRCPTLFRDPGDLAGLEQPVLASYSRRFRTPGSWPSEPRIRRR